MKVHSLRLRRTILAPDSRRKVSNSQYGLVDAYCVRLRLRNWIDQITLKIVKLDLVYDESLRHLFDLHDAIRTISMQRAYS